MALDLSTLTTEQQLAAIYIGYYDRAADPVGEDFWEGAVANPNLSLADIATDFATQPETLIAYPFLSDPTAEQANAFISEVYLNLFNRAPDQAGLEFWSDALLAAIDGTGALTVGEIILSIIEGAQDSTEGNDRTTILNKIEVATTWTNAAEAAAIDYTTDTSAQNSATSIIEGVTDEASTVSTAKSTIDNFFEPAPVPGEEYLLTSATDVIDGTADDDEFNAYIQQNPFAGGISNSLASADRLDGGAGNDRLYAELTFEFLGTNNVAVTDIQPRVTNIEEIDIEARDFGFGGYDYDYKSEGPLEIGGIGEDFPDIIVDAKNITGHNEIGSYFSDGDLTIENLTTLTKPVAEGGVARNTSEITVTMDHTDNFNSDGDASDLTVLFDNDYLLSGQEAEGKVFYFLLDEDAELAGNPNRLNNIDVDGIRFTITNADGTETDVTIESPAANVGLTHQGFVNALQAPLQALIADGTLPAGTTLVLDPTITDSTFIDDGSQSDPIPAIVLTTGDGSQVTATGFSRIEEEIGEYDVYGRFESEFGIEDQPISIDIDLHKVGRGGDGGDLIIGGKTGSTQPGVADGIKVFNINVLGAGNDDPNGGMTKPSSLGTVTSTGNELEEIYIATDPVFAQGETFASLEIRDGFDQYDGDYESGDLKLVNADAFLGDLALGTSTHIHNLDTLTAQGGGDITFFGHIDGNESDEDGTADPAQAYSYTTGSGDDSINVEVSGDAVDYAGSSLNVSTGDGDDDVYIEFALENAGDSADDFNQQLNQAILDNVNVETGAGDDTITVDNVGNANIEAGSGDDTIYTDGSGQLVLETQTIVNDNGTPADATDDITTTQSVTSSAPNAIWALNVDQDRVADQGGFNPTSTGPDDLPGEQLSLAYIGGATVTVTLSGAGVDGAFQAGGGVMANGASGAVIGNDGFESSVTIDNLLNGNDYFGTQADINAAILEAINEDAVLSKLLVASIGANNTLVVRSLTSGDFEDVDLRVDIRQEDQGDTAADWSDVEDEAQEIFQNSDISIESLAEANAGDYGAADLSTSDDADEWYDGLSVRGDEENSTDADVGEGLSNLHTAGSASVYETDNVIDGGAGDDVIVLSTDAVAAADPAFTVSSNNALIGGSSNETIKLTGSNIGNDTIMNFRDGDVTALGTFDVRAFDIDDGTVVDADAGAAGADVSVVVISGISTSGDPIEIELADGLDSAGIAAAIVAGVNGNPDANVVASVAEDTTTPTVPVTLDQVVFTATSPSQDLTTLPGGVEFVIEDRDTDTPSNVGTPDELPYTVINIIDDADVGTYSSPADVSVTNSGIDFLDFTAYLTSEEDVSTGTPDSSDSEQLIPVTLDNNTGSATPSEFDANEVVIVTYTDDTNESGTFANLSASDIEGLFDGDDFDGGALAASDFDVIDGQNGDAVVGGVGKAILMVENAANDGEYKVFELTWDASEDDGDEGVSATLLGSQDFGDSLADLAEVNLVGSEDHAALLASGFDFGA